MKSKGKRLGGSADTMILKLGHALDEKPVLMQLLLCLGRGLLGFVLSRAVIFGDYAPFGLGYAAAGGAELEGLCGMIGVLAGYAALWRLSNGLEYIAGTLLIFACLYAFRGTRLYRSRLFAPIAAASAAGILGFVLAASDGLSLTEGVLQLTNALLAFGSAYFYADVIKKNSSSAQARTVSIIALTMTFLLSLGSVRLIAGISAGRLAALLIVMLCAQRGGIGWGAAAGVALGTVFDASGFSGASGIGGVSGVAGIPAGYGLYSMCYGLAGLLSGSVGRLGKFQLATVFVVTNAAASIICGGGSGVEASELYEVFAASVIFILLPDFPLSGLFPEPAYDDGKIEHMRFEMLGKRAASISAAYSELYETLKEGSESDESGGISTVFDAAANRVCRSCPQKALCWEREGLNTYNVLNDITPRLMSEGMVSAAAFPEHFSSRCLKLGSFIGAINDEALDYRRRRHCEKRLARSRAIIAGQYRELTEALRRLSDSAADSFAFDPRTAKRVRAVLRDKGLRASVVAWRNLNGKLCVEIEGNGPLPIDTVILRETEKATGIRFIPEKLRSGSVEQLLLREAEPLLVELGVAASRRRGSPRSGDSSAYFKNEDGSLYIILSDGMGTGDTAAAESGSVVRLIERFIRAGLSPESAIKTADSTLMLKNAEKISTASADVLRVDLFSGEGELYKCGAAPTYLAGGGRVLCIPSDTMPIGAAVQESPDISRKRIRISDGERVLMLSDGAAGGGDDVLRSLLISADNADKSAQEMADAILRGAVRAEASSDDATVIVAAFRSR